MAVDLSVFGNLKTVDDYNKANDLFLAQKAAAAQALQSGQQDLQSKKNIYATQVLSAATATGDQGQYNNALQHLAQQGVDVSTFAPDVGTAAQQVQAARLAQSPIGALLNVAQKAEANSIAAAGATGHLTGNTELDPISTSILGGALGNIVGGAKQTVPATVPAAPNSAQTQSSPIQAEQLPPPSGIAPMASSNGPGMTLPQGNALPLGGVAPVTAGAAFTLPNINDPKYANLTASAKNQAFQADLDAAKADPAYQAAIAQRTAAATAAGKDQGTQVGEAANSQEITDRLVQNLQALKKLNPAVPDSSYMSPYAKAWFSKRIGSGDEAGALAQWKQIDQQQILSDLAQLVKSGAVRSNRTIAQMLQTGSGISPDEPMQARSDLIDNLLNEVLNKNTTIQNVNSRLNGGTVAPYNPILDQGNSAVASPLDPSQWSVKVLK